MFVDLCLYQVWYQWMPMWQNVPACSAAPCCRSSKLLRACTPWSSAQSYMSGLVAVGVQSPRSCCYGQTYEADKVLFFSFRQQIWAKLSHFSLSNRNLLDHKSKMCVCAGACWNTVLSGHTVQMEDYQSLRAHVHVLTPTWVVKCVCVYVCASESWVTGRCVWCF